MIFILCFFPQKSGLSSFNLIERMSDTHLHHHHEEHSQSSDLLRDIVIGMSDGLTVPFALAAGLSGAIDNTSLIVIAGLAEVAAGSIAMGLGGYLAGQTEVDHYNAELRREYDEVERVPEREKEEVNLEFVRAMENRTLLLLLLLLVLMLLFS